MQQFCFAFSFAPVWQPRRSPPEWSLLLCCSLTAWKPPCSPVWEQPVGENWAESSRSPDSSSQPGGPEGNVQTAISICTALPAMPWFNPTHCLFSDLFMSSVDGHRLWRDPGFASWGFPPGFGWSFHFPFPRSGRKDLRVVRFYQKACRNETKPEQWGKKTATQSDNSFALIRPDWCQPSVGRSSDRKKKLWIGTGLFKKDWKKESD